MRAHASGSSTGSGSGLGWVMLVAAVLSTSACGGSSQDTASGSGTATAGNNASANDANLAPDADSAAGIDAGDSITPHTVQTGLASPWSLTALPDGRWLVTEKAGSLRIIDTDGNISSPLGGVPTVFTEGQGGLLDLALGPTFAKDQQLVFSFAEPAPGGLARTAVARARLTEDRLSDVEVIFRQQPAVAGGRHFGSRLAFDSDGLLYITLGDRGQRSAAQRLDNTLGKVVRIHANGSVPASNPFVGQAGADPAIYTYGHRNAQSIGVHPVTNEIWVAEHGPLGGDELNRLVGGANYGWPRITHGREYANGAVIGEGTQAPDVEPALRFWVPVSVAPAGMHFYTGDAVAALTNRLLIGTLAARSLVSLPYDSDSVGEERRLLTAENERIRDVAQGADGHPYLITDNGRLVRLDPR